MAKIEIDLVKRCGYKVDAEIGLEERGFYVYMDAGEERIYSDCFHTVNEAVESFIKVLTKGEGPQSREELFPGTMDDLGSLCSVRK